ncbi:MAG: Gldg family protein [Verrucomicrobia bacterium]|nr:Gldg family protein [Verrucomicrobiota bacterium]
MNKNKLETFLYSSVGVAAMFLILVAVNFIGIFYKERLDLTAEKAYTLSAGTKAILAKLDTPVKIRFYFTQSGADTPVMLKTYAQRVEDLLNEYRQNSKGNIKIEKLDPQPDSDAEESASLDGVEGQQLQTGERIFLGVSVSCLDEKAALPFLSPDRERLLEYDLSRAISQVATPSKPVVGVMSSLPVFGMPGNPMMARMGQQGQEPWVFISELKRTFNVKQVEATAEKIDDDIKVLVVVHPRELSDAAQFALDQFVLRGGRMIAFLDPNCVVDTRNQNPGNPMGNMPAPSSLDKLLKAWGVEFDKSKVVADRNLATQMRRGNRAEGIASVLSLNPQNINKEDIATAQIDSLLLPFPGAFTGTPAAGLSQTVLLKTTKDSQLVESFLAQLSSEQVMKDFKSADKEHALAIRLAGKFKTAFPDGKPAAKDVPPEVADKKAEKKDDGSLKESKTENAVILVADADILNDNFCVQVQDFFGQRVIIPRNGNLNLAQNFVEQMTGDSNLIGVRSRATMARPFTRVREMQARAESQFQSKIKEIEASLAQTQARLNELQRNKEKGQRFIVSPEQQKEIEKFRETERQAKIELKEVRKSLRREIDSMENQIKLFNIAGMPFLVTLSGIGLAVLKRKRTAAK